MSGMISGLDTDAIVKELMSAQTTKKTKVENKKTKLEWKQEKWSELNTKIYKLYTEQVSKLRLAGNYATKKATSSNEGMVTATASSSAGTGTHTIEVSKLASSQYVTGKEVTTTDGSKATTSTKLTDFGISENTIIKIASGQGENATVKTLQVTASTKISDLVSTMQSAGLNASFDATYGRFFVSGKNSGEANTFTMETYTMENSTEATNLKNAAEKFTDTSSGTTALMTEDQVSEYRALIETYQAQEKTYNAAAAAGNASSARDAYTKAQTALEEFEKKLYTTTEDDGTETVDEDKKKLLEDNKDAYKTAVAAYTSAVESIADGTNTSVSKAPGDELSKVGLTEITLKDGKIDYNNSADVSIVQASDSEIILDGATLKNTGNSFTVAGVTYDLKNAEPGTKTNVTITNDTSAVFDMVKEFITQYNELLEEMNTLYNADSASGYEPLTDDEKEEMTEKQIELWEDKIKDSLLRRDDTLSGVINTMRTSLQTTVSVNGKTYSLSSFGIVTSSDYTENGKLHLYGDSDDSDYSSETNKLVELFTSNPDDAATALSSIIQNLYTGLQNKMARSSISSALTFYNDKLMKSQISDYETEISNWETKLSDLEDRYYSQFTAMETALAKLQSQSDSLSSLMGTG
jgi:flagellar hook-associated protein 2